MSAKPIKVLYFASVRTLLGVASEEIRPPPPPSEPLALSSLAGIIASRHQDKAVEFERLLKTCKWSVEQEMVEDEEEMSKVTLKGGEEVAIIPPGSNPKTQELKATSVPKERKTKPPPSPESLKRFPSSAKGDWQPFTSFSYSPSPSGTDSNLVLFFHGLGDSSKPFLQLGQNLQRTLPQTSILSLRALKRVPFLDPSEDAWMWWDSFDSLGEAIRNPNPTLALHAISHLLDYLISPIDEGGCGWPSDSIHLFGFGQGGSAALEGYLHWWRSTSKPQTQLGSIVSVSGGLLSLPTIQTKTETPTLYVHRSPPTPVRSETREEVWIKRSYSKLSTIRFEPVRLNDGQTVTEAMPRGQSEWDPILRFWSRFFRNRSKWEVEGELLRMG